CPGDARRARDRVRLHRAADRAQHHARRRAAPVSRVAPRPALEAWRAPEAGATGARGGAESVRVTFRPGPVRYRSVGGERDGTGVLDGPPNTWRPSAEYATQCSSVCARRVRGQGAVELIAGRARVAGAQQQFGALAADDREIGGGDGVPPQLDHLRQDLGPVARVIALVEPAGTLHVLEESEVPRGVRPVLGPQLAGVGQRPVDAERVGQAKDALADRLTLG